MSKKLQIICWMIISLLFFLFYPWENLFVSGNAAAIIVSMLMFSLLFGSMVLTLIVDLIVSPIIKRKNKKMQKS